MPVENERKFVMSLQSDEEKYRRAADDVLVLHQAYLLRSSDLTVRVRSSIDKHDDCKYYMTVKQDVGKKTIEIEKKISESDYKALLPKAHGWLYKVRYRIEDWEVDFFKYNAFSNQSYFVMAEIELADGIYEPSYIPEIVARDITYPVQLHDSRFSSKKLADVSYANSLLEEISKAAANSAIISMA